MAASGSTWAMVLRCHGCKEQFTVTAIPQAEVSKTADVTACPHCGYRPREKPFDHVPHTITRLTKEPMP